MNSQVQDQPQVVAAPQQQTVYMQLTPGSSVPNFAHKACFAFGLCQLIFGAILILLGIVSIVMGGRLSFVGSSIWCGIFFIITGSIGIAASKSKTKGLIIGTLVCSIIAAALSGGYLFSINLTAALIEGLDYGYDYVEGNQAVDGVMTILALAECVIAIVHSVICCRAVCCGQQQMIPVYFTTGGQPGVPMQPVGSSVGAQGTVYMMPQGGPVTGQSTGYPVTMAGQGQAYGVQGYNPQSQGYNPQGYYPQAQPYNPSGQAMYAQQSPPSMDSKPSH
ncbi:membrane-spanning 4-domains subfamily A member 4D-like [Ptychodera flava]|uniref:membrane-spanning 4-domains subfamily A member 4D-like n=1 Tax=Ptychodera flava TaxID=63121 RepID=UPI00396A875F